MLFEKRLRDGLADGSVTVALRRWRRPQAVVGGVYRTGGDGPRVRAVTVDVVRPGQLRRADAERAGYPTVAALLAATRGGDDLTLYRLRFERVDGEDPRAALGSAELAPADLEALRRRLSRADAASSGPWTAATLDVIARRPGVVSTELAAEVGSERPVFKRRVRVLKELGLTQSLEVGYRLTPRGQALLQHLPPTP